MWRQRNMAQIKEQNSRKRTKPSRNNLLDAEFKTLVIRLLTELRTSTM